MENLHLIEELTANPEGSASLLKIKYSLYGAEEMSLISGSIS